MLQTILHQLWNQRRQNGWIFLELLVVSFFLWTVIDPIYVLTANRAIDRGYNPEGLYVVNIGMYDETNGNFDLDMASDSMNLVAYTRLARIVREQPEVECWAISGNQSFPCSNSWSGTQIYADTASLHKREGFVHAQTYSFVATDGSNMLHTYGMKDAVRVVTSRCLNRWKTRHSSPNGWLSACSVRPMPWERKSTRERMLWR